MASQRCVCCGKSFHPRPQSPKQTYCSTASCQRERRRRWQQMRRQADPDYRENQARAQHAWATQHPDYWRAYRATHAQYCERNRCLQQERDARRRVRVLAKMDASTSATPVPSGLYRLLPMRGDALAKMDAWTVQITALSTAYASSG